MAGHLIITSFGVPAVQSLVDAVGRAKGDDPLSPVVVIVPTERIGVAARRGLARTGVAGARGVAGITVMTLRRLAETLATPELTASGRRPVTQAVLVSALDRLLHEAPGLFSDVADHPETARSLARTHGELRLLPIPDVARVAATSAVPAEVVRMHHATTDLLRPHYYDQIDLLVAAARLLDDGHASVPPVVLYLPGEPDPPQRTFVQALAHQADVTAIVGISGANGPDGRVLAAWRSLLGESERDVRVDAPVADRVVAATDADDEVRAVVRDIVARLAAGTPGHRIAALYGSRDPYARLLAEHLSAAGVTINGRGVRPASERILGRALRRMLALPALDFRRDAVMALVTDAPIHWDGERTHPTRWERISREAGIVRGDDWVVRLREFARKRRKAAEDAQAEPDADPGAGERDLAQAADADALAAFVTGVRGRLDAAERAQTWSALADILQGLWADLLGGDGPRWLPEEELRVAETIEGVLRSLPALDSLDAPVSLVAMRELVELEMDSDLDRVGRAGVGVHVGPVRDGVGHDLDAVYLVGLAEGLFPPRPAEDPLLPDAARVHTNGVLPTLTQRVEDQHRQFLAALAAAPAGSSEQPRRVLTFPRGDLRRGGVRLPSRWLVPTLAGMVGDPHLVATRWEDAVRPRAVDVLASHSAALLEAPVPATDQEWRQRAHAAGAVGAPDPLVDRARAMRRARREPAFTRFDGLVGAGEFLQRRIGGVLSPTALEAWYSCPHRYLLQHVLGVRQVEDPEEIIQISVLDKGGVMHRVLERFVDEALRAGRVPPGGEPWSDDDRKRLEGLIEEEFTAEAVSGRVGLASMWDAASRGMREDLRQFVAQDDRRRAQSGLTPAKAEMPFGRDGVPPVEIGLGNGRTLSIRGSIDRVDEGPEGLVVLDYKTGSSKSYKNLDPANPTDHGRYLQLGLYAEAARQLLGRPDASVWAGYWFVTRRYKYESKGFPVTAATAAATAEVLSVAVAGIEAGLFPSRPKDHSKGYDCWACNPDGLGERTSVDRFERLLESPQLAAYAGVITGETGVVPGDEGEPA
jgi:hypothetical protein